MRTVAFRLRFAVTPLVLLLPALAAASASYPLVVESTWDVKLLAPDGCQLCHQGKEGRAGTATQRFARTLIDEYQLGGGNVPALRSVLQRARADATDSDGDGTPDYDELIAGTDPNVFDEVDVIGGEGGSATEGGAGGGSADDGSGSGGRPAVERPPASPAPSFPALENGCAVSAAPRGTAPGQEPGTAHLLFTALSLALARRRLTSHAR